MANLHQRVVVVELLVEPDGLVVEPAAPEPEVLPEPEVPPVPLEPMELVLPLPPVLPLPLVPLPAVLPVPEPEPPEGLVDGLVVLEELVEPVAPVEPVVPSRLSQALSERAPTTARVAATH